MTPMKINMPMLWIGLLLVILCGTVAPLHTVQAQLAAVEDCDTLGLSDCNDPEQSIKNLITSIINIILGFVGLIAAIFVIIGGVRYIMSGGEPQGQAAAKNTILYALIGLVIVILSGAIVNLVITSTGGGGGAGDTNTSKSNSAPKTDFGTK